MELLLVLGCLCAAIGVAMLLLPLNRRALPLPLPPSPPSLALPILGHLHLLQPPLHLSLHKLSQKLGPIFFIWMGSSPAVVVSSPFWAREFWHERDRDFADRPFFEASKRIFYNCGTLVMMEYGARWRELRKLYTVHMLSSKRVEKFQRPRLEEMDLCIRLLEKQASGAAVDLRKLVFNTVGNMMTMMLFSKRSFCSSESANPEDTHFQELVDESARLFGTPFLGDLIPWLKWLDVQGHRKRMDMVAKGFDRFLEGVLTERIAENSGISDDDVKDDYLGMLLHVFKEDGVLDRDSIKSIILDLLAASIETTTTSIEWIMAELLNNPSCMKKLQDELDTLVQTEGATLSAPGKCVIGDSQITRLDYLQAVVKEALRLHPPFALILRQMSSVLDKGMQVGGFYLPKKTRVFLNLWAVARDTSVWGPEAAVFHPERFSTDEIRDPRGKHSDFLPFGTGRRGCPGMSMALTIVPFMVANLMFAFDWKISDGVELDLSEGVSITAPPAKPLIAIPTRRQYNLCPPK